jgi:hypothetical protein
MPGVCRTKHHLVVVLYMPSAAAEAEAAAMDNAVDVWRLNTASRLQTQMESKRGTARLN